MFIIVVPFTNSNYLLLVHAVTTPFTILRWILNNNTCSLTALEEYMREKINGTKIEEQECFTCRLIKPVYDFKNNYQTWSVIIYVITISLWLTSVYKLYKKYKNGELKTFWDWFRF